MKINKVVKTLAIVIGAFISAVLYRMGGSDTYNTKWRDIGCSLVTCIVLGILCGFHWTLILVFGAMWGSLTTYFKKKGQPVRWYNWLIVGLAFNVACLPYIWAMGLWVEFGIRSLILPLLVMGWSVLIGNAVVEELGRGAVIILSMVVFLFRKRK